MAKRKFDRELQFGILPWRIGEGGTREVLLLTSRETHRWVIPKGWPMKGRKPAETAILCEVRVFLFRVERQLDDWPEKDARETKWFDATEAAALVEEGGLAQIIERFAGSYVRFVAYRKLGRRHAPLPASLREAH